MLDDAGHGTEAQPSHGIMGFIPLSLVDDVELALPIDYLHDVCLRHTSRQLHLWFDPGHHAQPFSARAHVDTFDKRMKGAKAPSFISRQPKPFKKISHWKGWRPSSPSGKFETH